MTVHNALLSEARTAKGSEWMGRAPFSFTSWEVPGMFFGYGGTYALIHCNTLLNGSIITRSTYMPALLLFRDDEQDLDKQAVEEAFLRIGVLAFADISLTGTLLAGVFAAEGDEVIVELKDDLKSIAVSDSSPAGVKFAFDLQQALTDQLRLIDQAYNFDTLISEHSTIDSLDQAIL